MTPRHYDGEAIAAAAPWPVLAEAIARAFAAPHHAPERHIHKLDVPGAETATAMLMPAWLDGTAYGVKLVNVFPSNGALGLPSVSSLYALFDGRTGQLRATLDGGTLTARRTAATSVLAARYLARPDSRTLLMLGAGRLAPLFIDAYRSLMGIERVLIWARKPEQALRLAADTGAEAVSELAAGLAVADIVSSATLSRAPLICGAALRPGQHIDLVGAFTPQMRETDAAAIARARVFIDTFGGAHAEAGDLIQAVAEGAFHWESVQSDLAGLVTLRHPGRQANSDITLFKSVGAAIEDLATALLVAG